MEKRILIKSEEERLVYGEVYRPMDVDTDQEAMTAVEIRKMAHAFIYKGLTSKIDENHNCLESGSIAVESYIVKADDPDGFVEGAWVLVTKIEADDLWAKVKSGEINGYSFYGKGQTVTLKTNINMPTSGKGFTELSTDGPLPPHNHAIDVNFKKDGKIVSGETEITLSHIHKFRAGTATQSEFEHSHRLMFES